MMRSAVMGLDYLDANGLDHIVKRRVNRGEVNYDEPWFRLDTDVPIELSAAFDGASKVHERWYKDLRGVIKGDSLERVIGHNNNSVKYHSSSQDFSELAKAVGEAAAWLSYIHLVDPSGIHYPFAAKLRAEPVKDRKDEKVRQILKHIYAIPINYVTSMRFPKEERLVATLPHAGLAVD